MKNLLIASLMAFSVNAIANEKGNGGDAVVCRNSNGSITSAELLDYYEGRNLRGIKIREVTNLRNFITDKISFLRKYDPEFANYIQSDVDSFILAHEEFDHSPNQRVEKVLFTNDVLIDIPDSEHLTYPKECKVEQLAIRLKTRFYHDPSYMIQMDIWNKLSLTDKAGLVLHEVIYKKFADGEWSKDSRKSRYFNLLLSTIDEKNSDFIDYLRLAQTAGYSVEVGGAHVEIKSLKNYDEPRELFSAKVSWISPFSKSTLKEGDLIVFNRHGIVDSDETNKNNPRKIIITINTKNLIDSFRVFEDDKLLCTTNYEMFNDWYGSFDYSCEVLTFRGERKLRIEVLSSRKNILNSLEVSGTVKIKSVKLNKRVVESVNVEHDVH